jgi:hypothetical protein
MHHVLNFKKREKAILSKIMTLAQKNKVIIKIKNKKVYIYIYRQSYFTCSCMNFGRMSEVVAPPSCSKRSNPVARDEMFNRLEKSLIRAPPKH